MTQTGTQLAEYLTIPEAARELGVSRQFVWMMVKRGLLEQKVAEGAALAKAEREIIGHVGTKIDVRQIRRIAVGGRNRFQYLIRRGEVTRLARAVGRAKRDQDGGR